MSIALYAYAYDNMSVQESVQGGTRTSDDATSPSSNLAGSKKNDGFGTRTWVTYSLGSQTPVLATRLCVSAQFRNCRSSTLSMGWRQCDPRVSLTSVRRALCTCTFFAHACTGVCVYGDTRTPARSCRAVLSYCACSPWHLIPPQAHIYA